MRNYTHARIDSGRRSIWNHWSMRWRMFRFSIKLSNSVLKQVGKDQKNLRRDERLCKGLGASDQATLAFMHNEELAKRGERMFERMEWMNECGLVRGENHGGFCTKSFAVLVSEITTGRHRVCVLIMDYTGWSFDFSAVAQFLTSESTIADISSGLGFKTLIRCDVCLFETIICSRKDRLMFFVASNTSSNNAEKCSLCLHWSYWRE